MGTEDRAYKAGRAGEQENGEKNFCRIEYFCRAGENNANEDKVEVDPQKGLVVLVDMMGGHGKGYKVIPMPDGKPRVMSEWQYAGEVMGEKTISSSDQDQQRRIEENFGRFPTVGSWAGDKLVYRLEHDLEIMNANFTSVADLERELRSVARSGNEVLGETNAQLREIGLLEKADGTGDTGGTAVFGKLVTVKGEGHWAGLRIGDVRVGIRKADGVIGIWACGGMSIEGYAEGKFKSLDEYSNLRNRTAGALTGRESDILRLELVDIPVEKGDQMIFLTDGITDSLEWVQKPLFGRLDPWKTLKEIWNNNALRPERVIPELAERAAALTRKYRELKGKGKRQDVIEGCLPKQYLDDQAGALVVVGGGLTTAEKEEANRQSWQEVAEKNTETMIRVLADFEKNEGWSRGLKPQELQQIANVNTLFHWFEQAKPETQIIVLTEVGRQLGLKGPATMQEFRKTAEEKVEEMLRKKKAEGA